MPGGPHCTICLGGVTAHGTGRVVEQAVTLCLCQTQVLARRIGMLDGVVCVPFKARKPAKPSCYIQRFQEPDSQLAWAGPRFLAGELQAGVLQLLPWVRCCLGNHALLANYGRLELTVREEFVSDLLLCLRVRPEEIPGIDRVAAKLKSVWDPPDACPALPSARDLPRERRPR